MPVNGRTLTGTLKTHFEELKISTRELRPTKIYGIGYLNITASVEQTVAFSKVAEGIVLVQVKHTTAALVTNEDEKGLIENDLPRMLARLAPDGTYEHDRAERVLALGAGEPKNAPSHLRSVIGGAPSLALAIHDSRIQFGTWQGILLFDFDPESHPGRTVVIQVIGTTP